MWSNRQIIEALVLSLKIALLSATRATIPGMMTGLVLARFPRFRARTPFAGMSAARW